MDISRYLFQSPYSSQFQVGKVDPSSVGTKTTEQDSSGLEGAINQPLENASSFKATQEKEVITTVSDATSLDVYA